MKLSEIVPSDGIRCPIKWRMLSHQVAQTCCPIRWRMLSHQMAHFSHLSVTRSVPSDGMGALLD